MNATDSTDRDHLRDQVEQAVLGGMLTDPTTIGHIADLLAPTDFYRPHHTTIYQIILHHHNTGKPTDPLVIGQALLAAKATIPEGPAYLVRCQHACPTPANTAWYAHQVAEAAQTRRLVELAVRLHHVAQTDDTTTRLTHLDAIQAELAILSAGTTLNGANPIQLVPANTFRIKPVYWLWADPHGRIPIGEITLVPGREGAGKSILMAWLAAATTNGNLPGHHHGNPRSVLYAASEDSWEHTIAPRLIAAGARMDMIYHVKVVDPVDGARHLILPKDTHHLPQRAAEVGAGLLICDPVISLVDERINSFRAQELRKALEPLKTSAEAARLACVCLVHFNKTIADIMTMISGSRAWGEVARACIAVARDDDADDLTNVVTQVKNNLGRLDLPSLAYTIDDVAVQTDFGEDAHPGRLRWLGESDTTADDLLGGAATNRPRSDTTLAIIEFVTDMNVPVTVQDVAEHFQGQIRHETVKKALARCAKRGDLVSLRLGTYEAPKPPKRR